MKAENKILKLNAFSRNTVLLIIKCSILFSVSFVFNFKKNLKHLDKI